MGARERVTTWYPGTEVADAAPECQYEVHDFCTGNADLTVHGVKYESRRCACSCHPRGVRRVEWTKLAR
ncbi:hypothetical protein KGG72_gp46 [Streptomyces phage Salutena]|uniref:Uncharacterized protein n=1 Tax=Streptomyces phage Salutena TaxID=2767576 RepID=A0A7S6R714_9CAUD|nr:hypothetical protein KGG72_gp46 [Streptomyces phage Salutena]QOV06176.1 hypothetical protein CPT_Salutena_046 [Streptomyces phage Salutena]